MNNIKNFSERKQVEIASCSGRPENDMNDEKRWCWQVAELQDEEIIFDNVGGFEKALRDGFFFLKQPQGLDLIPGDRFSQNFYARSKQDEQRAIDPYTGFQKWTEKKLGKHQGYFCRDDDQTEQFFLESFWWHQVFPVELAAQAVRMKEFALVLLQAILKKLDLPERLWDIATGRCLSSQGTYTLTFNHFRSGIDARGLNVHKDSGWVTVLRSLAPGLEVLVNNDWYPIIPVDGMFVVNFGCAMEILMKHTATPVAAVAHRVTQQWKREGIPDRFSYAMFLDSSLNREICEGLYQYVPGHGLNLCAEFNQFLDEILKKTYTINSVGLY